MPDRLADYFHDEVASALGFALPHGSWEDSDFTGLSDREVEDRSVRFKNKELPSLLAWETRRSVRRRAEWHDSLTGRAEACLAEATVISTELVDARYHIARSFPSDWSGRDRILMKINHGFWEQTFAIFHDGFVPEVMRPLARERYQIAYSHSRFHDALMRAARADLVRTAQGAEFGRTQFGVSFGSGDHWHAEWLRRSPVTDVLNGTVARGVHAGLQLFLSDLGAAAPAHFVDGAYAKQCLLDGSLAQSLGELGAIVDRVIFCVPPHLATIRLEEAAPEKQEILHVSGRYVHDAWPLTLAGVARPILRRLAEGEHVAVIVQAAVFSALLAFVLGEAKAALSLPGRLSYLDLGQALDAADPVGGGIWARRRLRTVDDMGRVRSPFILERQAGTTEVRARP